MTRGHECIQNTVVISARDAHIAMQSAVRFSKKVFVTIIIKHDFVKISRPTAETPLFGTGPANPFASGGRTADRGLNEGRTGAKAAAKSA